MTTKVRLHGKLKEIYGESFTFNVASVSEIFTALGCQIKGFREYVTDKYYKIFVNKDNQLEESEIHVTRKMQCVDVFPAVFGSGGRGLLGIVAGAALIGLTFVPGLQFAAPLAPFLLKAGIGLVLGGVAGMLAPQPSAPNYESTQVDQNSSALFDGPKQRAGYGIAIPISYGEVEIAGILISSVIKVSDTVVV